MFEETNTLTRFWEDLINRPNGPMSFRFLLQPVMATIFAIRDGIADARANRAPYLHTVLTNPAERGGRLREGLKALARVIVLGLVMDAIYQFKVFGVFYPFEAIALTLVLAFLPYLIIRGPAARIARRRMHSEL